MTAQTFFGGFPDTPRDAARAFRALMSAMARPGTIVEIGGVARPPSISPAAGAVLLTLCDPDTPLWLAPPQSGPDLGGWIGFHTGAPLSDPADATFALGAWPDLPLDALRIGTPAYPDRSATVIVEMEDLRAEGPRLSGPGIETTARLSLPDPARLRANAALFPLGLDFIFCAGTRVAALPRSTRISGDA